MKPDKGNNKKNAFGLVSLILWALVLTLLFRSCTASYASANEVEVESSQYTITLKEGMEEEALEYLPEEEEQQGPELPWLQGGSDEVIYVTTPPPVADLNIYDFLDNNGVEHYFAPAVDNSG